jgi:hypothetical protein
VKFGTDPEAGPSAVPALFDPKSTPSAAPPAPAFQLIFAEILHQHQVVAYLPQLSKFVLAAPCVFFFGTNQSQKLCYNPKLTVPQYGTKPLH